MGLIKRTQQEQQLNIAQSEPRDPERVQYVRARSGPDMTPRSVQAGLTESIVTECIHRFVSHVVPTCSEMRLRGATPGCSRSLQRFTRCVPRPAPSLAFRNPSSKLCHNWLYHRRGIAYLFHICLPTSTNMF